MQKIRVVLCTGQFCNIDRCATVLLKEAEAIIDSYQAQHPDCIIHLETANCLSMCGAGPNCVIYPESQAYHQLTVEQLRIVLAKNLQDENILTE